MTAIEIHPASYRDPAGFVFSRDGVFYRQVNRAYARQYEQLIHSGLYDTLTREALLIPHTEISDNLMQSSDHHLTLLPKQLTRLSYPAEWCPEQLRDAALLTLKVQRLAMDHGMVLKDATPFNIQFDGGKALFIDTLSFDIYDPARPWIAYRQFCENFLFPLYVHRYTQTGTHKISGAWPDGIPVATTARLLPLKSRWNSGAWLHVFLQNKVTSLQPAESKLTFSKAKLTHLIEHLRDLVSGMVRPFTGISSWSDYYSETSLGNAYLEAKEALFRDYLRQVAFTDALDLGCNDGRFSSILAGSGTPVTAVDSDWPCISKLYRENIPHLLPLCIDLANPTPAAGFRNAERASFDDRSTSDLVVALALVHHLALRNHIPLPLIAAWLGRLTRNYLIIEFVPLSDKKAMELISRKATMPSGYDSDHFESAFSRDFRIARKDPIAGTDRLLYLLEKI